jgi:diguanylate cyclase (GGDEF)-like protein/PAS domain S-box-containing protein
MDTNRSHRRVGLSRHVQMVVVALVVGAVVALGVVLDRQYREEAFQRQATELETDVRFRGSELVQASEALRGDTLFLSRTPPVRGIIRAAGNAGFDPVDRTSQAAWVKRMQEIFTAFLITRPAYFQARYIGVADGGRELVRVDRTDSGTVAVAGPELQRKGGRDYFQAALGLAEGAVYLSDFNLNRERGGIPMPAVRTLRAVTPVHGPDGRLFGLIVVNMDVGPLLRQVAGQTKRTAAYLVDDRGRYLAHPDPAVAFAFETGSVRRWQDDFPALAGMLVGADQDTDTLPTRLHALAGRDYYVAAQRLRFDPARLDRFVLLAYARPQASLVAEVNRYRVQVVVGAVLALALLLPVVFVLVARLMAPLNLLGRVAESVSQGRYDDLPLPDRHTGEVGALVKAFRHMREQVAQREEALRLHNAALAEQVSKGAFDLRLAASVVDNTSEGVMVTDARARILSVNSAFSEITGYSAQEAIGNTPRLIRSDHHDAAFYKAIWDALLGGGRWQGEIWNRRKSGEVFLEWLTINRIAGATPEDDRFIAVFTDVTEQRRKDERIHHLAFHDPLTGLPNRALVQDRLQHAIDLARRKRGRTGVMLIDLDRFKAVNDGLGHDVGDLLLKEVAARLTGALRQTDTVARMGGDEFLVILESEDEPETYAGVAEHIIAAVSEPIDIQAHSVRVGASIGIAFYPDDGEDVATLIKHADVAMYAAKADGKGVFRFYRTDMTERATRFLTLEMELRRGIAAGELELHYQPKVSLQDGGVDGVEALVRWRHPQRGLVSPVDFIPVAEESGLIVQLGDWVLAEACRQAALWQGRMGAIAVNVSARQFDKVDLVERVRELTGRHGIAPASIQLELTESTVMKDPARVIELLGRVRELGISVAVDDFGTGYSSLAYLRRLPIDTLKIDRSFVRNVDADAGDRQIARTIIALGQALGMAVVAEGVETEAQAQLLRAMGCDLAQGYLYARPQAAAELERWLEKAAPPGAG